MMGVPPFLLIDAGNTRLKWAVAGKGGPIRCMGEVATKMATRPWIETLARKFPAQEVVVASVVPRLGPMFRRAFAGRVEVVTGVSSALGLAFDYPKPAEIGADRLAAAVAAHHAGRWPVIIVSCGTATAFTVLDAKGRFCGGAIAPGLQAQLDALLGATAQLPATTLRSPRAVPAHSTKEAIRAGVILNFRGGVVEILRRLSQALPGRPAPRVLLTGGHAQHLGDVAGFAIELRPLLVFEGLRMIGLRTRAKTL